MVGPLRKPMVDLYYRAMTVRSLQMKSSRTLRQRLSSVCRSGLSSGSIGLLGERGAPR